MKNYLLIIALILMLASCRKRNSEFSFAGVWEITKVEQIKFKGDTQTVNETLESDTLGWFGLQNATGMSGQGKIQIKFSSFAGLSTDYATFWTIDEYNGDRIEINDIYLTRERFVGGEKWTWIRSQNNGADYTRETIFVKKKK